MVIKGVKIGDKIDLKKHNSEGRVSTEGWSDTTWIVTEVYPYCVIGRNLDEDGKFGKKTRGFSCGDLKILGMI